ncbi:MAG: DUF4091 domain-containing protein, partial [Planctomycetes bacterium]|nr:DUF4091 domain-containing protein [Planctomycetota bacterium]
LRFDASPSVQPAVSPTGAALAETDEVLVWHEVPSRKALGQEAPPPRKAAGVRLAAAQGEYEPFQLVIRGKEQMPYTRLERMEIEVADLKRQGGAEIASQNVTCALAEFVDLRYPKGLGWSGPMPDALPEARRFACEPGRNTILWITVKVPRETPPGLYDGSIHLHHGLGRRRARLATVPLLVRVFGFAIPEERHFSAWLPFSSRLGIAQMYEGRDAKAIYDRYVRNYVEHRAGLRFVSPSVRFKEGSAEIEQIHLKPFEDDLRHHFDQLKMPHVNCRSFNIGAGHELTPNYFGKPDDVLRPLWRARYRRLAKVIGDWLREKQWQDRVIFELFDEPVEEHIPILAECLKMLKAEFPDIRVTYAAMWVDPRLCGLVNVWMTGGGYAHIPLQKRRAAGDTLWFGNNNHASVDRLAAEFRLTWWRYWLDGIAGCNHWHVGECNDWLRKGKWDRNRIATWLLPGEDGPINTIRWELTREGLEDYEYLWLLHHAVQNAKADGADATDGERALARVNELVIRKGRSLRFNPDPALLHEVRDSLGAQIEKLARFLPAQAK